MDLRQLSRVIISILTVEASSPPAMLSSTLDVWGFMGGAYKKPVMNTLIHKYMAIRLDRELRLGLYQGRIQDPVYVIMTAIMAINHRS